MTGAKRTAAGSIGKWRLLDNKPLLWKPAAACILLVLLFVLVVPGPAAAADPDTIISEQLDALPLEEVENYLSALQRDFGEYLPAFGVKDILAMLRGEGSVDFPAFFRGLLRYLFREVVANSNVLGRLIVLAVFCAVLQNLQSAFENETIAKLAHNVCYFLMLMIAMTSFSLALTTGRAVIDSMVGFMQALLPLLLTLLAALGGITTVALLQPLLIFLINIIGVLVKNFVFPLLFFAAVLDIVGNLSEKFKVTRFSALLREISVVAMSLSLCGFLGLVTIQGAAGSVADGVALRTAKYLTGTFVPIVGGMLTDAVEVVAGCSIILKNAVGIFGLLAIFFIAVFPLLKIAAFVIIYKTAGALLQPLGNGMVVDCLNSMGNCLALVFAAVATVGVMFFVAVTMIIGAGNITVMMR